MGHTVHHAIIVTSSINGAINAAAIKAEELLVFRPKIINGFANNYKSFLIAPSGFKKRDAEFIKLEEKIIEFKKYINGIIGLDWVEAQFGDDDFVTKIIDDSTAIFREEKMYKKGKNITVEERLDLIGGNDES